MPMTSCAPRLAEMNARPPTHAGMPRPARKKSVLVFIEPFNATPMPSTNAKYKPRISQSIPVILNGSFHPLAVRFRWGTPLTQKGAFTKHGAYMTSEAAASICPSPGSRDSGCDLWVQDSTMPYKLTVNGRPATVDAPADMPLLWVIRDVLNLRGTKYGCGIGQCGACQAGQMMSAAALLAKTPKPTDRDIDVAMNGNICRCGTYIRIRQAIHKAAALSASRPGRAAHTVASASGME